MLRRVAITWAALCLAIATLPGHRTPAAPAQENRPRRVTPQHPPAPSPAAEQDPDDRNTLELRSDLVQTTVSVTDASGRAIGGLAAEDFDVREDGKPQRVEHFELTGDPYTLMLVVDTSGSTSSQIDEIRVAAREFIAGLGPEDRIGIIVFSKEIEILGDPTSDRAALGRQVASIGPTRSRDSKARFDQSTGTSLYDALYLACVESPLAEARTTGRRAVVLLSDCVDSSSTFTFGKILPDIERSQLSLYVVRFDTQVFSDNLLTLPAGSPDRITFSRSQLKRFYTTFYPDSPDRERDPRTYTTIERLEINGALYEIGALEAKQLADRTGGRVHHIKSLDDLGAAYRAIAAELRTRYTIGYYPTNARHDGSWRALSIRVPKHPKATVVTRPGYWAPK